MAAPRKSLKKKTVSRSGSRAPTNPTTKAQRLTRAAELTERMDRRLVEVEALGRERHGLLVTLREEDGATFKEIATAVGKSEQAIHKAFHKPERAAS